MCICNHGDNLTMVISVVWGGPVTTRFYIHLKLDEPPWALTPAAFQCAQEPAVPEAGSGHSFCPPTTIPTPVAAFFWASEFDSPLWLQQVSQLLSFFSFSLSINKNKAMQCHARYDLGPSPREQTFSGLSGCGQRSRERHWWRCRWRCWWDQGSAGVSQEGEPLSLNWLTTPSKCWYIRVMSLVISQLVHLGGSLI